jgi:hypothetical protein
MSNDHNVWKRQVPWSFDCLWIDGFRMHRRIYRFPFSVTVNELIYSISEGIVCNYEEIWERTYTWNCTGLLVVNLWITRSSLRGLEQDTKELKLQTRDWILSIMPPSHFSFSPVRQLCLSPPVLLNGFLNRLVDPLSSATWLIFGLYS